MTHFTKALVVVTALLAGGADANAQQQRVEGVHESIGYADAIQVGNTVYVSGVVVRGANMEEQVTGIYAHLKNVLAKFGATLDDVVKETVFTTDMEALKTANPARLRAYGKHVPAATWVQIQRLYMTSALLEIEVIAVPGSGKKSGQ
jgi:2-iminobutanoate/2-iminopropanoate deaminase